MSVKIRLARGGARNRPFFRVVIAESSAPRDGRFIERIGSYDPMLPKDHPKRLVLDTERAKFWLARGATPSERVAHFLGAAGVVPVPKIREQTKKSAPRAKTVERLKAKEEARKAAAGAAAAKAAEAEEAAAEEAPSPAEAPAGEAPPPEAPAEESPAEESPAGEA